MPAVSQAQDPAALVRLIERDFAAPTEGDIHAFLGAAARAGLVATKTERIAAKDVFRTYLAKHENDVAAAATGAPGVGFGPAGGTDLECNDTSGFADTLTVSAGGNCVVNGTVGSTGDSRDVFRLVLTGGTPDHSVVISTVPAGSSVSPPSILNLADVGQRVILDGSLLGTTRSIGGIGLPDGTYFVTVAGSGAYTLSITSTGTTIPTLTTGATGGFTMAPEVHTYRLQVGVPAATVHVDVTNQTSTDVGDYSFVLGRGKGGRVLFMDDVLVPPAGTPQNDPVIDAELPAGTYYLYLREFSSLTTNADYVIHYASTPMAAVPNAIGRGSYTMVHGGSSFLYSLRLSTVDHFNIVVSRSAVGGDSVMEILDAEQGQVLMGDDSASGLSLSTLFSYADNTLPAGQYWVLVRNFSTTASANFGNPWSISGTAGLPVASAVLGNRRTEPLAIGHGAHFAFTHTACTETPLSAAHAPSNLSLVGADGLLRGYFRDLPTAGSTTLVGTSLGRDEVVFGNLMNRNYAASTSASVSLSGQLGIDLTPVSTSGAYRLVGEDDIGNTHYLFLSVGPGPGFDPGAPFQGRLCLDLLTLTPLLFHTFTSDCRVDYTTTYFGGIDLRPFIEPATTPGLRFQAIVLPSISFTDIAQ
ncbi:MAG: hypothetical protein R3F56_14675 [Planctomycetota bacterium]